MSEFYDLRRNAITDLSAFFGFLIGFGTRYAGGCTSGHSITGIANLNWPSLLATICFFAGGLAVTWGLGTLLF